MKVLTGRATLLRSRNFTFDRHSRLGGSLARPSTRPRRRHCTQRYPRSFVVCIVACLVFSMHARAADMQSPVAVAAATDGTIYVADSKLPGIWRIAGSKRTVYFQADKKFRTQLNAPRCLAIDAEGHLLVGDSATREIYRFDESAKPAALTAGKIGIPMGLAVDKKGDILVADLESHRVMKIPAAGGEPTKVAEVPGPQSLAIDAQDRIWVTSRSPKQVYRIAADGKVEPVLSENSLRFPHGIAVDAKGNVYVSDGYGKSIWKIDAEGKPLSWVAGMNFSNPMGLAMQGETLFVADSRAKQIFQIDPAGNVKPVEAATE